MARRAQALVPHQIHRGSLPPSSTERGETPSSWLAVEQFTVTPANPGGRFLEFGAHDGDGQGDQENPEAHGEDREDHAK